MTQMSVWAALMPGPAQLPNTCSVIMQVIDSWWGLVMWFDKQHVLQCSNHFWGMTPIVCLGGLFLHSLMSMGQHIGAIFT